MDEQHIPTALLGCHLANGLQEGLAFDVAYGATDFRNDHVHIGTGHGVDPALDFVRDVGDNLDGAAQIAALPFPVQDGPINLTGRDGGIGRKAFIHKTLVMSQIQVGFRAVVSDEDLAVLIGTHGTGVHIQVGVKLLVSHPEPPLLQKPPQRSGTNALSQAGHHTTGDKNIFHTRFLRFISLVFGWIHRKFPPARGHRRKRHTDLLYTIRRRKASQSRWDRASKICPSGSPAGRRRHGRRPWRG